MHWKRAKQSSAETPQSLMSKLTAARRERSGDYLRAENPLLDFHRASEMTDLRPATVVFCGLSVASDCVALGKSRKAVASNCVPVDRYLPAPLGDGGLAGDAI